jgi:hypothetical protein
MPKKFRPPEDYWLLKVSILKFKICIILDRIEDSGTRKDQAEKQTSPEENNTLIHA